MNAREPRPSATDRILTGIARSGTTLACTLLNKLPDVVALHEPMSPGSLAGLPSRDAIADRIAAYCEEQRTELLERGRARSRCRDGVIPENPFADEPSADGRRRPNVSHGVVRFDKPLSKGFTLVVKHPSCFTALLDVLPRRFPCFAIVRNPLAVLLSWHTTSANWTDGRQPAAEMFDDGLRHTLDREADPVRRQVAMLAWSFSAYARHLPAASVVRYEDLVASGGAALAAVVPAAAGLREPLRGRNTNPLYGAVDPRSLARRLLDAGGPWESWYPPDSIADLAATLRP